MVLSVAASSHGCLPALFAVNTPHFSRFSTVSHLVATPLVANRARLAMTSHMGAKSLPGTDAATTRQAPVQKGRDIRQDLCNDEQQVWVPPIAVNDEMFVHLSVLFRLRILSDIGSICACCANAHTHTIEASTGFLPQQQRSLTKLAQPGRSPPVEEQVTVASSRCCVTFAFKCV